MSELVQNESKQILNVTPEEFSLIWQWAVMLQPGDFAAAMIRQFQVKPFVTTEVRVRDEAMDCEMSAPATWPEHKHATAVCAACGRHICPSHQVEIAGSIYCYESMAVFSEAGCGVEVRDRSEHELG